MGRTTRLERQRAESLRRASAFRAAGRCGQCGGHLDPGWKRCGNCRQRESDRKAAQELPHATTFLNRVRVLIGLDVLPSHDGTAAQPDDEQRFAVWDSWRGIG